MKQINYTKIRKERRFKTLWISKEEILNCIVPSDSTLIEIKRIRLPTHYYIANVAYVVSHDAWAFLIGSEEFPKTTLGAEYDSIDDNFKYTIVKLIENKDFKVIH